jgi:hypothetical protein
MIPALRLSVRNPRVASQLSLAQTNSTGKQRSTHFRRKIKRLMNAGLRSVAVEFDLKSAACLTAACRFDSGSRHQKDPRYNHVTL